MADVAGGRIALDLAENGGCALRAEVCAGALAIVGEPGTELRIAFANGIFEQLDLARGVVQKRRKDLAHEVFIVQCYVSELRGVEDIVDGGHDFIVGGSANGSKLGKKLNRGGKE
jgi:hypothetical protein